MAGSCRLGFIFPLDAVGNILEISSQIMFALLAVSSVPRLKLYKLAVELWYSSQYKQQSLHMKPLV